jgi:hypothetical protein
MGAKANRFAKALSEIGPRAARQLSGDRPAIAAVVAGAVINGRFRPIHAILEQTLECPLTPEPVIGSSSSRIFRIVLLIIVVPGS